MNKYILVLTIIATFFSVSCNFAQNNAIKTKLSTLEFKDKIKEMPTAPLIDVRTPEEFSKGHLLNSKNIDWNGNDFQSQISTIDKTKPVFIYCLSGGRSGSAASKMRAMGFAEVYELGGGIMGWRNAQLPETTEISKPSLGMSKQKFDELLNSDKLILIDFYADWCAPCLKMKPFLEKISKEMEQTVVLIRINADENPELCKQMEINGLPVLQLYKNKKMTWSHDGFISKVDILKQLKK